ncbi:MAG: two pore domain potassium channel family protein [Bacteroidales bacterium]|nr:two pore domain potassium channel family protein [Bacteroidales bacterium]
MREDYIQSFYLLQGGVYFALTYIYFSTVTITTVGYGDIHACLDSIGCQLIIITEVLIGMFFILIFLSTILKEINFSHRN